MQTAFVLGGTYPHAALIQKLKERGYYTVLVDYLNHPVAHDFADEHLKESTLDMVRVCELARRRGARLVISTCIDQANVTCCYVAEKLGLPKPYTYEASLNVTDKVRMKNIMQHNHIPTARHYTISSLEEYDPRKMCFPIIVKPADCNSSKGVRRIEEGDMNAMAFIQDALALSRNGQAIIEEYIVGREIGVDCMIVDGNAHIIMTRERNKIVKNDKDAIQQIYGSFWPANLTESNIEQLRAIAERIAFAFKIDNTPLMMQTLLRDDTFTVIEFGARIGGGDNYQIIEELTGYDIIQNAIRSFLGEPIEYHDLGKRQRLLMDNYLYVNPPCTVSPRSMQRFGDIFYNDLARSVIEYDKVYRQKGDFIDCNLSSNNRVGCFVVGGTTEQELLEKQALVVKNMEIHDCDGNPIMRKDIYP